MTYLCKILSNLIMAVALIVATFSVSGFIEAKGKGAVAMQAAANAPLVVGGRFDRTELDRAEADYAVANGAATQNAAITFGAVIVLLLGMIVWLVADWKESAFAAAPAPSKDPKPGFFSVGAGLS